MNKDDLINVMGSLSGRAVIYNIIVSSGYFTDTFDKDNTQHNFNAGQRSLGVKITNDLKAYCYENYIQMLREHEHVNRNTTN